MAFLGLIEIIFIGLTHSSKLEEDLGFEEDASLAVFFYQLKASLKVPCLDLLKVF